jgi:hypothetical protein
MLCLVAAPATALTLTAEKRESLTRQESREAADARKLVGPLNSYRDSEEALRQPLTAAEIEVLSELGATNLHVAMGLDARRRDEVERLLVERLTAEGTSVAEQFDLALRLAALGGVKPQSARRVVEALGRTMLDISWKGGPDAVLALVPYLDPEDVNKAAAILVQCAWRGHGVGCLLAVVPRLERKDAARWCGYVAAVFSRRIYEMKRADDLRRAGEQLGDMAAHLDRKIPTAAAALARAAASLEKAAANDSRYALDLLEPELVALAPYLDTADARKLAAALSEAMTDDLHPVLLLDASRALAVILSQLGKGEAAERAHRAIVTLNRAIARTTENHWVLLLTNGLAAMAQHLDAQDAVATFNMALGKATLGRDQYWIAQYMVAWASRQQPKEGTAFLIRTMRKTD